MTAKPSASLSHRRRRSHRRLCRCVCRAGVTRSSGRRRGPVPDARRILPGTVHRFTENGETMAWMSGFNEVAREHKFAVVYPNGPGRRFAFLDSQERDDVARVIDTIEDVAAALPIDRSRIYLTGASNGGFLTIRMACLEPQVFAAAASGRQTARARIVVRARMGSPSGWTGILPSPAPACRRAAARSGVGEKTAASW